MIEQIAFHGLAEFHSFPAIFFRWDELVLVHVCVYNPPCVWLVESRQELSSRPYLKNHAFRSGVEQEVQLRFLCVPVLAWLADLVIILTSESGSERFGPLCARSCALTVDQKVRHHPSISWRICELFPSLQMSTLCAVDTRCPRLDLADFKLVLEAMLLSFASVPLVFRLCLTTVDASTRGRAHSTEFSVHDFTGCQESVEHHMLCVQFRFQAEVSLLISSCIFCLDFRSVLVKTFFLDLDIAPHS